MICGLLLSGQSAKTLSEEYGVDASLMRNKAAWRWKKQHLSEKEAFTGSGEPSLTPEEKEIRELSRVAWRKRLREAEMERDILKKAVGIGAAFRFSKSDSSTAAGKIPVHHSRKCR